MPFLLVFPKAGALPSALANFIKFITSGKCEVAFLLILDGRLCF